MLENAIQKKRDDKNTLEEQKSMGGPQIGVAYSPLSNIMSMQKTIGNRATAQLVQRMQVNNAKPPIQLMEKKDFEAKIGTEMNIASKMKLGAEVMKFKQWLNGTVEPKDKNIEEYIQDDEFTMEKLVAFIAQYKQFQNAIGPEIASNKIKDVPVPQGMFVVASQSELETGLYTDGVAPCVAVGFHAKVGGDGKQDVLALGHFDSETDPNMLLEMYQYVIAKLGDVEELPPITIYVAGGTGKTGGDVQDELTGPQLFESCATLADNIASKSNSVTVKRRSVDGNEINVRMDSAKGMKRFKNPLLDHKDADQLSQNPDAQKALDFTLKNGQMLKNKKGDNTKFGNSNLEKLQSAAAEAANQE